MAAALHQFTDTSERGLEKHIADYLTNTENGNSYILRHHTNYNRRGMVDEDLLFQFLEDTQEATVNRLKGRLKENYRSRILYLLNQTITKNTAVRGKVLGGTLFVLKNGINVDGEKLKFFFEKPAQVHNEKLNELYAKNIFSVIRQLHFSNIDEKSLDMGIFINGIPIMTFELKNELTKQNVKDAINQYKKDRNPKEPLFLFGRCLVHFAVDTEEVWMTTELKKENTSFLPFNKGYNEGAGNSPNGGIKTDYLWKDILTKDSIANIIQNYIQFFEEESERLMPDNTYKTVKTKKLIFPRFHQLDAVRELLKDAKTNGTGKTYLVQHSAGSGKSNSISWLAHQLASLFDIEDKNNIFDSIIVVTDRIMLDRQLQNNIKQFEQVEGLVETITEGSRQLKEALKDGKKIIITTIQKFPVIAKEIGELENSKFAVIIDEAHSGTSGSTLRQLNATLYNEVKKEDKEPGDEDGEDKEDDIDTLLQMVAKTRKLLNNASYFAFTATPKNKTLELFGEPYPDGDKVKFRAFHSYSMKQAIEEHFIEDVLLNYTTYGSFYNLYKKIDEDPEFDKNRAQKKLKQYVESHPTSIEKKTAIMLNHFVNSVLNYNKIKGLAKAMVVTSSRKNAVLYKKAFDKFIAEHQLPFKALVAFSGEIHGETESSLNGFASSLIADKFKKIDNRILIVANKFQTGFDQPLLHTMYVDKKLGGVNAVQTLSRLNRTYPGKEDTFVLDFANTTDEIKNAFDQFYETTILSEATDPHKLFDLQTALDAYGIYNNALISDFATKIINNKPIDELHSLLNISANLFKNELNKEEQEDFKVKCKSFVRLYVFLSQITPFESAYLEKLYLFLNHLQNKLGSDKPEDLTKGILDSIDLDSLKYRFLNSGKIVLEKGKELQPIPTELKGGVSEPEMDHLSSIVKEFNDRFGTEFSNEDKVRKMSKELLQDVVNDVEFVNSFNYSDEQVAKITFEQVLKSKLINHIDSNFEVFKEFNDNPDFRKFFTNEMFNILQKDFTSFSNRPAL